MRIFETLGKKSTLNSWKIKKLLMQTGVKVGECMRRRLPILDDRASVFEAAALMKEHNIDSLLVAKGDEKPYGIVTKSDIVFKAIAGDSIRGIDNIKTIASRPLITISPDSDIEEAAKVMSKKNITRLVVSDKKTIFGVIDVKDLIRISPSLYDLIAERV